MRASRSFSSVASKCTFMILAFVGALAQAPPPSLVTETQSTPGSAESKPIEMEIPADQIDAVLNRIASHYFDIQRVGLRGFKCTVRSDWRNYFGGPPSEVPANDPQLVALNSDKLIYTLRFGEKDSFEFENAAGADLGSSVIDQIAQAKKKDKGPATRILGVIGKFSGTLTSVMTVWTKYSDLSSVIPNTQNVRVAIAHSASGYRLERSGKARLVEIFDDNFILQQSYVEFADRRRFTLTTFNPSAQGLVISEMHTYVEPLGNSSPPPDKFGATFEYQLVDGFPLPAKATFSFTGQAPLIFEFSECQANPPSK